MLTTKEITKKYNISRQSLYNWFKSGKISRPQKNEKLMYIWTKDNEKEIDRVVNEKKSTYTISKQQEKFKIGNRRYLGSKQKMLDFINTVVSENANDIDSVADIFGGTGVVANLFREQGKNIIVNDILFSNFISFNAWFSNEEADMNKVASIIDELNGLKPKKGYVSRNFGDAYFSMENAYKIDAIREKIESYKDLNYREYCLILTSLLYAMDKIANTVGHYDAFRQKLDSYNPIFLKIPEYNINSNNQIYNKDANELVKEIYADLVYIDTPYNSRGYENTYHVLENIAEWKKPPVEGVARKAVNRSEKGSDYTKSSAPQAFDDLIQNINAKYILVSYNNMNKKGNSRSNAKISNEEIINSLSKRGSVTIFETDFSPFTTGKSKIVDHKELLYLCKIKPDKKNKLYKSALNYTGGKYKLLPQLFPLFPEKYNEFVDLFAGGATVALNLANVNNDVNKSYMINDNNSALIDFYRYLYDIDDISKFINKVEQAIVYYNLSNTKKYGYEYYHTSSALGVSKYNKEKFLKLRSDYNLNVNKKYDKHILFYLLIIFGFNNQIRFNTKGEYNLPVGKRDFNISMEKKLRLFHNLLKKYQFTFQNKDFRKTIDYIKSGYFVYADPPYRIATATYNENGLWTLKDDIDLFNYLDAVHQKGAKFALSNVIVHNGKKNMELINWASKYNLQILDYHYNNSNYQSKAKMNDTVEVLITNYNSKEKK